MERKHREFARKCLEKGDTLNYLLDCFTDTVAFKRIADKDGFPAYTIYVNINGKWYSACEVTIYPTSFVFNLSLEDRKYFWFLIVNAKLNVYTGVTTRLEYKPGYQTMYSSCYYYGDAGTLSFDVDLHFDNAGPSARRDPRKSYEIAIQEMSQSLRATFELYLREEVGDVPTGLN